MKTYSGRGCRDPSILDLGTTLRSVASFTPRDRTPVTQWVGVCVGPQNHSQRRGEENKTCPYRNSNNDPSTVQPVASRYTDCAIPDPQIISVHINIFTLKMEVVGSSET
jgi:hypothetical protein